MQSNHHFIDFIGAVPPPPTHPALPQNIKNKKTLIESFTKIYQRFPYSKFKTKLATFNFLSKFPSFFAFYIYIINYCSFQFDVLKKQKQIPLCQYSNVARAVNALFRYSTYFFVFTKINQIFWGRILVQHFTHFLGLVKALILHTCHK